MFCLHKPFDLAKGFAIDDLHVIFLGTVLDLLVKWFAKKFKNNPYSIRLKVLTLINTSCISSNPLYGCL